MASKTSKPLPASPSSQAPAVEREQGLYAALMAALPEAVVVIDSKGRVEDWSEQAQETFGWTQAEMLEKPLLDLISPTKMSAPGLKEIIGAPASPTGQDGWMRLPLRRKDGDVFTAAIRITPTTLDQRKRHIAVIRDITDALLAEQQLAQAQKLEALSHLTGGLAHDFNNILGIIIGSLDLIAPTLASQEERELVQASLAAAHRGAEITRSLLAVARRRAIKPQVTDVNKLIDEITPLLRQTAGKQNQAEVSAVAIKANCMIDPGALSNALINLVINSRDAMPEGGRILVYAYTTDILPKSLTVPLELKAGSYLVIGVDDTGTGMPPEVALRAFDPFFTTKARGRGTGLGLAMVYGFARQSGGTARIQSAPGVGTSVQIFLPTLR